MAPAGRRRNAVEAVGKAALAEEEDPVGRGESGDDPRAPDDLALLERLDLLVGPTISRSSSAEFPTRNPSPKTWMPRGAPTVIQSLKMVTGPPASATL
jgi:hypothetical protein